MKSFKRYVVDRKKMLRSRLNEVVQEGYDNFFCRSKGQKKKNDTVIWKSLENGHWMVVLSFNYVLLLK